LIGKDFLVFWQTGQAVLAGLNPYTVPEAAYPPAATLLFALLSLVPFWLAFPAWTGLNVALYVNVLRQKKRPHPVKPLEVLAWFTYMPFVFVILFGQIDILFLWLASFLVVDRQKEHSGWVPPVCAALITLKPQAAFILLPWPLLAWLRRDRRSFLKWLCLSATFHLLPLLYDPGLYSKWLVELKSASQWRLMTSPGIFSLSTLGIPFWILAVPSLVVAVWGVFKDEKIARAAMTLALPMGFWYEDVLLSFDVPAVWMVPLSWAALLLSMTVQNSMPLMLIPLGFLAWGVGRWLQKRRGPLSVEPE
jgi:hypothetical protein